jgi:hypothetical protein
VSFGQLVTLATGHQWASQNVKLPPVEAIKSTKAKPKSLLPKQDLKHVVVRKLLYEPDLKTNDSSIQIVS